MPMIDDGKAMSNLVSVPSSARVTSRFTRWMNWCCLGLTGLILIVVMIFATNFITFVPMLSGEGIPAYVRYLVHERAVLYGVVAVILFAWLVEKEFRIQSVRVKLIINLWGLFLGIVLWFAAAWPVIEIIQKVSAPESN